MISTYDFGLAFAIVLVLNAILIAAIAAAKIRRERRMAQAERVREELLPRLLALVDAGGAQLVLPGPESFGGTVVLESVVALIAGLKGGAQRRLVELLEENGYVAFFIGRLRSRDSVRRAEAAMLLGASRSRRAVDALIAALLRDRSAEVRMIAAEALGSIGDTRAVEPLMGALQDPERYQPLRIADVLASLGPAAVPELETLLNAAEADTVVRALDVLIAIGAVQTPHVVNGLLEHPSAEVRARAAALLGRAGIVDSVPLLARAAEDASWFVRLRAAKALKQLEIPDWEAGREAYFAVLERLLSDRNWYVRRNASAALAASGDEGLAILRATPSDVARAAIEVHRVRHNAAVQTIF